MRPLPWIRHRAAWALVIAAALAFKSFVPLLAAAAAGLQGKDVADICSVYGVRLAGGTTPAHGGSHDIHHAAGMQMPAAEGNESSPQHPATDHAAHSQDHCALTGLAAYAVSGPAAWFSVAPLNGESTRAFFGAALEPRGDASTRWLTARLHAPPPLA